MTLILLLVFLSNTSVGTSYILTGALNGGVSCLIGAAQAIINYFYDRKEKKLPVWLIVLYAIAFTTANLLVFTSVTDILAILACLIFIGCICQQNGKKYRLWLLANALLCVVYDVVNASYGPLITHGILLVITVFGMIMHDRNEA
jgi:hypothetical protein